MSPISGILIIKAVKYSIIKTSILGSVFNISQLLFEPFMKKLHTIQKFIGDRTAVLNPLDIWLWFWISFTLLPILNSVLDLKFIDIGSNSSSLFSLLLFSLPFVLSIKKYVYKLRLIKKASRMKKFMLASIVFALALKIFALFYYTIGLEAPILHDPYEHSLLAKTIVVSNRIDYFYSPLLHSAVATLSFGNIWNIPLLTVLVNNLSVLMIPVVFSSLYYYFTKNLSSSFLAFLLISCLHFPANLYSLNGKYALIVATSLIPVCIYSLDKVIRHPKSVRILRATISLFLLFLAHYPTFGIFCYLIAPWLLFEFIKCLNHKNYRKLIMFTLPIALAVVMSLFWMLPRYYIQQALLDESVVFQERAAPATFETIDKIIKNLISYFELFFRGTFHSTYASNYSTWHLFLILPVFTSLFKKEVKFSIVWAYFSLIILSSLFDILQLNDFLGMVIKTLEIIYIPMILVILIFSLVTSFNHIPLKRNQLITLSIFLISVIVISSYYLHSQLESSQSRLNLVDQDDLKAYEYINRNIEGTSTFLTAGQATVASGTISPVDGGMWIPLYTENKVTADFITFTSEKTNEYYKVLTAIKAEEDDSGSIEFLRSLGVEYAYIDIGIWGEGLNTNILSDGLYEIIFESGTVKIIKFK